MTTREDQNTGTRQAVPDRDLLTSLLNESASHHKHLCPRQVLGVRLGLRGLRALGLVNSVSLPRYRNEDKRLLTIAETDGCGLDGLAVSTGCSVGHRTLRVIDFGKVAATLIDTVSQVAIRVAPTAQARTLAPLYAGQVESPWHAYLTAYQVIPDHELIQVQRVQLTRSIADILSKPDAKVNCAICGEEIINEREVYQDGEVLCRSCAGEPYYRLF